MNSRKLNLTELFVDIAQAYPEQIAVKDDKRSLTYAELYQYACRISKSLIDRKTRQGDRIVCVSKKDVGSIACFWGILLCGAVPVMLDFEDGKISNAAKIRQIRPHIVILDKQRYSADAEPSPFIVLDFDDLSMLNLHFVPGLNLRPIDPADVCYILLTSGTTGNSKAVQIWHRNVVDYTYSIYQKLGSPERVNAIHASTFAADLGLTNLLVALVSGGMLRILNKSESTDPAVFNQIIADERISLLKITPSHLLSLILHLKEPYKVPIENVVLGGEKLSWETVRAIFSSGICSHLFNHYGPTETTIGAIAYKIGMDSPHFGKTGSVPLGTPLGDGKCFLDVPEGTVGELCVTGPGVSIGYFENEAENARKFMTRAFPEEMTVCYRTGDICRKLDDGCYEFLYRTDRQFKVKGYRIELGEIELAIAGNPDVENVIATVSAERDYNVVEAYVKPIKGRPITTTALRQWLSERLPDYKIPSEIYFYSEAPYNSNGKIDLNALRRSFGRQPVAPIQAKDDTGELPWPQLVVNSWKRLLNRAEIADTDNFFEIGGDSLLAIQFIGRLQRFDYKVHISDLNNHPVLKDFIRLAPERSRGEVRVPIEKAARRLTYSQQSFLRHEKFNLNNYCQTILLETDHKIMVREMALALNCIVEGHVQLTSCFRSSTGINGADRRDRHGLKLGTSVLDGKASLAVRIQETGGDLLNEISLEKGNLFVAHIFVDPSGKDYLFLACHHLAVDVISWNIILDELLDYYDQIIKGHLPAIRPENTVNDFFHELFRRPQVKDRSHVFSIPKIYRLPKQELSKSPCDTPETYQLVFPDEISGRLKALDEQDATSSLSGFLLSVLGKAVLEIFSLEEITIDLEFHGRPQEEGLPDLSRSVAWWATTMPVNLYQGRIDPVECSALIDEKALQANNINLSLPDLILQEGPEPADIRLNYLGHFPGEFANESIRMTPSFFNPGPTRGKNAQKEYKLYFTARFIAGVLTIDAQYETGRHSRQIVQRIMESAFDNLQQHLGYEGHGATPFRPLALESNMASVGLPAHRLNGTLPMPARKTIFLTGGTGFLGAHLLEELSRSGDTHIYCLVRGEDQLHAEHRLESCFQHYFKSSLKERPAGIEVIRGDLLSENLGIEPPDLSNIVENTDIVLHSAADTNLMKDYSELVYANTLSVKNIIGLAEAGKGKEVHYVSTLAVSGCSPAGEYKDFSETDFEYGQRFISDYERTKFEAERIVREYFGKGGAGKIYRVGHIAADHINGRFQKNIGQNRIFQVLAGIMLLKKVPDIYHERVSFSYVDVIARAIGSFCLGKTASAIPCIHLENAQYLSFIELAGMLNLIGYDIGIVGIEEFKRAVEDYEGTLHEKNIIRLMDNWIRRYIEYPRRVNYIQRHSLDTIARSGLYFPKADLEWFSRIVREGIKAGYFHSPESVRALSPLLIDAELL